MKEQWKKHDSDAKLLLNVEEGRPQPIKIELPISAFGLKQDGCCNRLITFLRVAVLFALLLILSWIVATLYSNYYPRQIVTDEKTEQLASNPHDYRNEENKFSFRNKVYAMLDENEQNEIHSFTTTSTTPSVPTTKLSADNNLDFENMQILSKPVLNQENMNENELKNEFSLETELHGYIIKERFSLENMPELQSINEDDRSTMDQAYDNFAPQFNLESEPKIVDSSINQQSKDSDSDKENSMEVLKNRYESAGENESNEVLVIPSLEEESAHQPDEDLSNYMNVDADEIDQLITDIASLMGIYEEPSSEVNQSNEEFAAVIQEEIKNNEEKLEIGDLDNVSSAEDKSREEAVAIIQEEIKVDEEDVPTIHLLHLNLSSEEEDPDTEDVAVIQEEIKNDSGKYFELESIPVEDSSADNSQENTSSENSSLDDLDKNVSHDTLSDEDKLRETVSITDIVRSIKLPLKPVNIKDYAFTFAKILEPVVGDDYKLVHWYYNVFMYSSFVDNLDKEKVYAAKVLYNQNITEYDADMQMWINQILEGAYPSDLSEITNFQKQSTGDTFLQQQIVDKLLEKMFLKAQYDLNMITFNEVWEIIDLSNSDHIKSWFLATHPSLLKRQDIQDAVLSMDARRRFYLSIKDDLSEVTKQLINEHSELDHLEFDYDDFNVEPLPSILEQHLILYKVDVIKRIFSKEKSDETIENFSTALKLADDLLQGSEHELTDDNFQWKQIQKAIFNSQNNEFGGEYDSSEVPTLKYQSIIEAMKKVGEEYDQTEKSAEETTTLLFQNHDQIEESVEETDTSSIKNEDDEEDTFKEEISPSFDQFETSNTNLNPNDVFNDESTYKVLSYAEYEEQLKEDEKAFLKWLSEHAMNIKPEENEYPSSYDPYYY